MNQNHVVDTGIILHNIDIIQVYDYYNVWYLARNI